MRRNICKGTYEQQEIKLLKKHLDRDDRVLELGACVGYISAYASKAIGSENVVTVEANPALIDLIGRNHKLNGVSPKVINACASYEDGRHIPFYVCDNVCSSGMHEQAGSKRVDVDTVDVNRLVSETKSNFLIADIEGGEVELFEHLDLNPIEKILIEIHPQKVGDAQSSQVVKKILDSGFNVLLHSSECGESESTLFFVKESA